MSTADDFKTARFATHPDGRIAARVEEDDLSWAASDPSGGPCDWFTDDEMADHGFVPLSESLPSTVTDERRARQEDEQTVTRRERTIRLLNGMANELRRQKVEADARAEKAEKERDEARADAASLTRQLHDAQQDADMSRAEAEGAPLTAREHLDAAWSAGYVPADGIISARTPFLFRANDGGRYRVSMSNGAPKDLPVLSSVGERRLLDEPTPKRPEGAEAVESVLADLDDFGGDVPAPTVTYAQRARLADLLAEHGVRVTEDGAP